MANSTILIVDDDIVFLKQISKVLSNMGYITDSVNNPNKVIEKIKHNYFDLILMDLKMPGIDGISLMKQILSEFPQIPIIMISGQSTVNKAVEAMKLGAFDFIEKPIDSNRIHGPIKNAIKIQKLQNENLNLSEEIKTTYNIVGQSDKIIEIKTQAEIAAKTDAKILITGETGTGKEIIAKYIHYNSMRKDNAYIKVNCAAIPDELLESELFGHKQGAFTGAYSDKKGKFLAANNGTIFLDEIGDMNPKLQAKILRVLEEGELERVGDISSYKINVRIISATNKDLKNEMKLGNFREDLYHRLNLIRINIPPLRERESDIMPLSYHFIKIFNETYNKKISIIESRALNLLIGYEWPGNVRELRNVIEKAVIFCDHNAISHELLLKIFNDNHIGGQLSQEHQFEKENFKTAKANFEKNFIIKYLNAHNGNIAETAEAIGIDRSNLFRKIQAFEIDSSQFKNT